MSAAVQLLVVSSDAALRDVVRRSARSLGHEAIASKSANDARRALTRVHIDVLCLDSVLSVDEIEQLSEHALASTNGEAPCIVYLGPRAAVQSGNFLPPSVRKRIDAFVAKPVDGAAMARELALLLSERPARQPREDILRVEGVVLDNVSRKVHLEGGATVALTPVEHNLLRCLMEQAGDYVSKAELLDRVWGYPPEGGAELVRAHVCNLRRKLRAAGQEQLLSTMPFHGYAFVPAAAGSS